jgi:hypothetical protein
VRRLGWLGGWALPEAIKTPVRYTIAYLATVQRRPSQKAHMSFPFALVSGHPIAQFPRLETIPFLSHFPSPGKHFPAEVTALYQNA